MIINMRRIKKILLSIMYGYLEILKALMIALLFAGSLGGIIVGIVMLTGEMTFHWLGLIYSLFSISLIAWVIGEICE